MEEFIFDDDAEDVGAEVEAYCPKCRADTTHVVVSKYEDEIRKVQCNSCGDVHAYRKPKGEDEEEATAAPTSKKKQKAKPTYDQAIAKWKKPPRAYAINEYFKELEVVSHPKFGIGFVSDNIGEDKIEVTFKEDKRVLIHNRKNLSLPFLRPLNSPAAKGQKGAAKEAPAAPAAKGGKGKAAAPAPEPVATPVAAPAARADRADKKPAPANTKASAAARPAAKRPVEAKAPAKAAPAKVEKADKKAPVKVGKAAATAAKKPAKAAAGAKAKPAGRTAAHVAAKKPAKGKPVKKLSKKSR